MFRKNESMGDRIKRYRMSIKMTQADFAQRLGVTGAAVSAYENGVRQPSLEILVKIANILGTTTDNLLGRTRNKGRTIDVTQLTDPQLQVVEKILALFVERNELYQLVEENEELFERLREEQE